MYTILTVLFIYCFYLYSSYYKQRFALFLEYNNAYIMNNKFIFLYIFAYKQRFGRETSTNPSLFHPYLPSLVLFFIYPFESLDQIQRSARSYSILVAKEISHDLRRGFESGCLQLVILLVFSKIIVSGISSWWLRDNARSFKTTNEISFFLLCSSYRYLKKMSCKFRFIILRL